MQHQHQTQTKKEHEFCSLPNPAALPHHQFCWDYLSSEKYFYIQSLWIWIYI